MDADERLASIRNEINISLQHGYLSVEQVQILNTRLTFKRTYDQLISQFGISGRTALTHSLVRIASLEYWVRGMGATGVTYLCKYDDDLFLKIIEDAADDCNCIPAIYAVSLAHYLKKKHNSKAYYLLMLVNL